MSWNKVVVQSFQYTKICTYIESQTQKYIVLEGFLICKIALTKMDLYVSNYGLNVSDHNIDAYMPSILQALFGILCRPLMLLLGQAALILVFWQSKADSI